MVDPLVSVLIPTFDRSHYLADAVTNSMAQTLDDIEIVVVDDDSIDRTTDLLAEPTHACACCDTTKPGRRS
jgi:glycosyltransferase involved in cell wall biosynthesis